METLIVAALDAGYVVQCGAALIVVVQHAQDKTTQPEQLMR